MKQVKIILFALSTILLASCGGSKPGKTVEEFLGNIQKEKYTEAAQLIYVANAAEAVEVAAICEKLGSYTKEQGGIKSYEVLSEDISEDGNTAIVKVQIIYNDMPEGVEPDINNYCMRKIDKQWKIDISQK